ncbi:MAG: Slp family lipoprotein [Desulfobacterales bacterium]|nr:MAG: Slp family lipoprotein [Desulfobacterales bacterium]
MTQRSIILLALMTLLTTSCSVVSQQIRSEAEPRIPFETLVREADRNQGRTVILGGYILETQNRDQTTEIKVLQAPLRFNDEPDSRDYSEGRFIIAHNGFLDPEIYKKDRKITVAGTVSGSSIEKVGNRQLEYLRIQDREIHLWPEYEHRYPYYDPYWYYPYYWYYPPWFFYW